MKASRYNFFYRYKDDNSKYIAYNALSSSLALIEEEKYEMLKNFLELSKNIDDKSLLEDLEKGGYLIQDDFDELDYLRFNMFKARMDTSSLSLTIAPTSDCNFRCIYCYEKDAIKPCYITLETELCIIKYIEKYAKTLSFLSVTWYGGEPLLAKDSIKRLSNEFHKICKENNVIYVSDMVSNGYLFNDDSIAFLNESSITALQITLDGNENTHNVRRPLLGGKPTFDKIISNLEVLIESNCKVTIRINVDRSNMNEVNYIVDELENRKILERVMVYLAKVENINQTYKDSMCLSEREFEILKNDFETRLISKGIEIDSYRNYPISVTNTCGCDKVNSYVINADGSLYKCWDEMGREEACLGNINEIDLLEDDRVKLSYISYDPTSDIRCKECEYLPICMGGCHYNRISKKDRNCKEKYEKLEENLLMTVQQLTSC